MKNLPSLKTILIFEASSRHKSFSSAAKELNLTPGAVSKQIQKLEESLSVSLFERNGKSVFLTEKGQEYLDEVIKALHILENATCKVRKENCEDNDLLINIAPSFCDWLINKLQKFYRIYPQYRVNIINKGCGNLESCNADISIYAAKSKPIDRESHLIYKENLLLIAHPDCKIQDVSDLLKSNFLEHNTRKGVLEGWANLMGFNYGQLKVNAAIEHFSIIIEMVEKGLGVGLVPDVIVEKNLKAKQVVNILNINYDSGYSYYVTYPKHKYYQAKIVDFRRCIL